MNVANTLTIGLFLINCLTKKKKRDKRDCAECKGRGKERRGEEKVKGEYGRGQVWV